MNTKQEEYKRGEAIAQALLRGKYELNLALKFIESSDAYKAAGTRKLISNAVRLVVDALDESLDVNFELSSAWLAEVCESRA